eukprot:6758350-Pyramimonas_sp.AAC.1
MQLRDYGEYINPYFDQKFRTRRCEYVRFLKMLRRRGLIRWSTTPKEIATPFFVRNKDGRQRLTIDARRTNQLFRDPPSTLLATPESFARLEVGGGVSFMRRLLTWTTASTESVSTAAWAIIFAHPPFRARELGLARVRGRGVPGDGLVWAAMA